MLRKHSKFLSRREASDYLIHKYGTPFTFTPNTLAKMAAYGHGPQFIKIAGRAAYCPTDLDAWALKLSNEGQPFSPVQGGNHVSH